MILARSSNNYMKFLKFFTTTILLFQTLVSFAQSEKEMEAIAKYQLAEESYSNNEFDKALSYLDQAKEIMGNKPKLLYLQITIELDKGYNTAESAKKILKTINTFENSQGIDSFSQDKKMTIAKSKILLKEKLATLVAEEDKLRAQKEELAIKSKKGKESFEKFTIDDLPFGLTVEEFQNQYPDILPKNYKISKTKWATGSEADMIYVYHPKNIAFENKENFLLPYNASTGVPLYDTNIHAIIVKDGKVVGFQKNIFYYNSKGNGTLNYMQAISEQTKYVDEYKKTFESYGTATDAVKLVVSWNQDRFIWGATEGDKEVDLYSDNYVDDKNPKRWKSSLTVRVFKKNK